MRNFSYVIFHTLFFTRHSLFVTSYFLFFFYLFSSAPPLDDKAAQLFQTRLILFTSKRGSDLRKGEHHTAMRCPLVTVMIKFEHLALPPLGLLYFWRKLNAITYTIGTFEKIPGLMRKGGPQEEKADLPLY